MTGLLWGAGAALAGCSATASGGTTAPASAATTHAPAPSAPAPSPVSTAATVTGTCTTGYEMVSGDIASGVFLAGQAPAPSQDFSPALAYQLTLTATGGSTADVSGFAVAFLGAGGTEDGSDQQDAVSGFILPGQSLTWTVLEDRTVNGYGTGGNPAGPQSGSIPLDATACQFVTWYRPASTTP